MLVAGVDGGGVEDVEEGPASGGRRCARCEGYVIGSMSSMACEAFPPSIGTGGARAETIASLIDPFCGNGESGGGVGVGSAEVGGKEEVRGAGPGPGPGVRFGISSIRDIEPVGCACGNGVVPVPVVLVDDDDESPKTRDKDKDGKVNVLECPLVEGPSSFIVSSFAFSFSLSLSGFLRKGRASDGSLRKVDVDVDVVVVVDDVEGGMEVGTGDEVVTGVRFLPKGGSLSDL